MSDAVLIALFNSLTTILVVLLSRLWSRYEHRQTALEVKQVKAVAEEAKERVTAIINGK